MTKTLEDLKKDSEEDVEVQALKEYVKGLKSEIKNLRSDYGNLKGYFHDMIGAMEEHKSQPLEKAYNPEDYHPTISNDCVAVLHCTDWHYGMVQDSSEVEGFNEYSPEIAEARIINLVKDFVKWVNTSRMSYPIDHCIILDTGDNISGDIHDELRITNAFPTPVQAFKCGLLKAKMVSLLEPHFKTVKVEFCVPDNHGRLVKKPQAKQSGFNTHNYVVGHVAKLALENLKNVDFNIYTSHFAMVHVLNRNYLLTHGHNIKGWAGFPWYGADRMVAREALKRLHKPDEVRFHKVIAGHYHTSLWHPWYWFGASASGTDAFDHQCSRHSEPIQNAWMVHPEHDEFNRCEFKLYE